MNGTVSPTAGARGRVRDRVGREARIVLHCGEFLGEAIAEESSRLGVTDEELVTFAVLYYLADLDSERTARRRPPRA